MTSSKIEWTDSTWNPITGCTKISEGCRHCYAERMASRLKLMGVKRYRGGFNVCIHEDLFEQPLSWKKPRTIFLNSMSDIFHEAIPFDVIHKLFKVMEQCPQHTFQVLTKRAEILADFAPNLPWPKNVWMGVTVESEEYASRIKYLKTVPAAIRFISFEPLINAINPIHSLKGIQWVIVGGESGPGARAMDQSWVSTLKQMAERDGSAFFFKQWGGVNKKKAGRVFAGQEWNEMPKLSFST
jgi:protein gp37